MPLYIVYSYDRPLIKILTSYIVYFSKILPALLILTQQQEMITLALILVTVTVYKVNFATKYPIIILRSYHLTRRTQVTMLCYCYLVTGFLYVLRILLQGYHRIHKRRIRMSMKMNKIWSRHLSSEI
jgi:hypothetical protein